MDTSPESVEIYCLKCRAKTGSRDVETGDPEERTSRPSRRLHCVRHGQVPHRLLRMNLGRPRAAGCTLLVWWVRERDSAPGSVQSGITGPGLSVAYKRPGRSRPPSGNAVPLSVSVPESLFPSIELRSPGRSLRTAMASARRLPTTTTSLLPLVIAVYSRLRCSIG